MRYIITGIVGAVVVLLLLAYIIFIDDVLILKIILIPFNIFVLIVCVLIIWNGFKLIKIKKEIELLERWPKSN